tara:strand:- start:1274 stop:1768 length:495 start_codon:yes stop_codon:yes gene_type:complete
MILLGIDPGTARVGYGVVEKTQGRKSKDSLACLDYGIIETASTLPTPERLHIIHKELRSLIKKHRPDLMAVESVFFFKNLKTALPVSEARGVVLLAAAQYKVAVCELTPLQAKMAVTGYGRAQKKQVQRMVQELLSLPELPRPDDAADALGLAIACTVLTNKSK